MTRNIVPPEEAQRLLDTPTSIPGSSDWDFAYVNAHLANFLDAGPDLAHTVIQQAEQIKQLQARVGHVRKAVLEEGRHPPYHRRQVEHLRREWPTLYHAIMGLVR